MNSCYTLPTSSCSASEVKCFEGWWSGTPLQTNSSWRTPAGSSGEGGFWYWDLMASGTWGKKTKNKRKEKKNTLGWCAKPDKQITKIDFIGLLGQWTRENPQPGYWTFILQSSPISKNYNLMCKEVNPCTCKPKIIWQMCVEKVAGDWLSHDRVALQLTTILIVDDDWNH